MARDEREEEREFLERLQARTGRDLAEWMAAIAAQGFLDKNETIDWLRGQGLSFPRASWLERIHANGGKPIYGHTPARAAPSAPAKPVDEPQPQAALQSPPEAPPPPVRPQLPHTAASMEKLIAAAKGYRPLYHMLEGEIRKSIPAATPAPRQTYISIGAPAEFAAITLHATEVRLGFDLGDRPFDSHLQKSKLRGPGPAITHMTVLTDARQVNTELLNLLKAANGRVNKQL